MATTLPLPPQGTPVFDRSGQINILWGNYYLALQTYLDSIVTPPVDAQYWLSTADPVLTNERNIGALASGYMKIATTLGVATPSTVTGIPAADLTGVVSLSHGGTGANLSGTGGASQVLRQSSSGAAITVSQLTSGDISGDFMAIGGAITDSVPLSLLFVDSLSELAQGSVTWDESLLTLTVGMTQFIDFGNGTWGIGVDVLEGADPVSNVIAQGRSAATRIRSGASGMIATGDLSGYEAYQSGNAILTGTQAGFRASNAPDLLAHGNGAARDATNAASAIMGGGECGRGATNAARVLWWGREVGKNDPISIDPDSEDSSTIYGNHSTPDGYINGIILGPGLQQSADGQMILGGVLFALNVRSGATPDPTPVTDPLVGIGTASPVTRLDMQDGALTIKKMGSDPATPATDCAVLWGRDDGGGKFEYMIKFDDASEVQIAVQP